MSRSGPTWPPTSQEPTLGQTVAAFSKQKNAMLTDVAEDYLPLMIVELYAASREITFAGKAHDKDASQARYIWIGDDNHAIIIKNTDVAIDTHSIDEGLYNSDALLRLSAYAQDEITGLENIVIFNDPVRVKGIKAMLGCE